MIETFFELSEEDAEEYRRLLSGKEYRAVQEVELTWADRLMEKGREKGREEGVLEGKRETLVRQLTTRFGELPPETAAKVEPLSAADLDSLLDRVLTAGTLNELLLEA